MADLRARVAGVNGSNLDPLVDLGLRRLIPSLEQVTFSVPMVTPTREAIFSQLTPRATRYLICWTRSGVNLLGRCDIAQLPVMSYLLAGTLTRVPFNVCRARTFHVQGDFASHSRVALKSARAMAA
jgi:hypothetical protein